MKAIKYLTTVSLLALAVGCSTSSVFRPWKMEQVQQGMAREQVVALLGAPESTTQEEEGVELLHYSFSRHINTPFEEEAMMGSAPTQTLEARRTEKQLDPDQYVVRLENGKVLSCYKKE